jgi:hypothetical protein
MSMVRSCMRLAAVAAIRERCWKQLMVRDSDNRPLDVALTADKDPPPYAVVFTSTHNMDSSDANRSTLKMTVEIGLAGVLKQSQEGPTIIIPVQSDSNFELSVDALDRDVRAALINDPRCTWGQILKEFAMAPEIVASERGGTSEGGARWAARQIVFDFEPIVEPEIGVPLATIRPMMLFLAKAKEDPMMATAAGFIEAVMTLDDPGITAEQAQAMLAVRARTVRSLGIAPADVIIPDKKEPPRVGDIALPGLPYDYSPDRYRPLKDVVEGIP